MQKEIESLKPKIKQSERILTLSYSPKTKEELLKAIQKLRLELDLLERKISNVENVEPDNIVSESGSGRLVHNRKTGLLTRML